MFTVPVGDWFKGELHPWLRETLTGSEPIQRLFEASAVTAMLDQHRDGTGNFTRELRALAAIALWNTTC
jgi:asparagine synthase (glutamine-hydrolysing)